MGDGNSVELLPVKRQSNWRIQMMWPNGKTRYFGNFSSKNEAARWVEGHTWLKTQVIDKDELRVRGGPRMRVDPTD